MRHCLTYRVLVQPGVALRIGHLAMAIQFGATVYDLEESELCYAPPFGSAKDPVNFAGMIGADVLRGDMPVAYWGQNPDAVILDVREKPDAKVLSVGDAVPRHADAPLTIRPTWRIR